MVSATDFYKCFKVSFKRREAEAIAKYDSSLTGLMLAEDGVFAETLNELKTSGAIAADSTHVREFYTIDMMYCSNGNIDPVFDYGQYPMRFDVLIEHENGEDPEQEVFKLLLFRAPLKVVVSYDWDDDQKTTQKRRHYLLGKLTLFQKIIERFNANALAEEGTSYLFIVGNRNDSESQRITWRAWAFDNTGKETEM